MKWNDELPNVDHWKPNCARQDTLRNALMITCQLAQARILARAEAERRFNINNFDSGLSVEDIVRAELASLLPNRYKISPGIVSDRDGRTAGECDIVVLDHLWSSAIRPGPTVNSRRTFFPIENIYAAAEIKQTLGFRELDKAMEKLVTVSRLNRPDNPYGHITENQHLTFLDRSDAILNPLHTIVIASQLDPKLEFENIVSRFGAINSSLNRANMVKMLCILGHGAAWYSVSSGVPFNANYMTDRHESLILQIDSQEPENVFYRLYLELMGHLTRSVLGLSNTLNEYGKPPPKRRTRSYPGATFNS